MHMKNITRKHGLLDILLPLTLVKKVQVFQLVTVCKIAEFGGKIMRKHGF